MDTEITLVIGASVFVFCLLVFLFNFVLKYQKKTISFVKEKELLQSQFSQTLLQSQVEVQESTLSTISKELHDNIGQLLSTAKILLGVTERNIANPPDTLITASETVSKAISELRSLSKSLNKEWLQQFDLIENLATEVRRLNATNTLSVYLSPPDDISLEADKQIILFRIIQEAVQNAVKHAGAANIYITISSDGEALTTIIKDNGRGFEQQRITEGMGILNMKHRTKLLDGTIEWNCDREGSTVVIKLPLQRGTQ